MAEASEAPKSGAHGVSKPSFQWLGFLIATIIIVGLHVAMMVSQPARSFDDALVAWPSVDWSQIRLEDGFALAIAILEGIAAGAAIALALTYVFANPRFVESAITEPIVELKQQVRGLLPAGGGRVAGASTFILTEEDAERIKALLAEANDQRIVSRDARIAELESQIQMLERQHKDQLNALYAELAEFLNPILTVFESTAARMTALRDRIVSRALT